MARKRRPSYERWLKEVNEAVLSRHGMSIFELDDDIPREQLRGKFESGISPRDFVDVEVSMIFMDEEDYA